MALSRSYTPEKGMTVQWSEGDVVAQSVPEHAMGGQSVGFCGTTGLKIGQEPGIAGIGTQGGILHFVQFNACNPD